MMIIGDSDSMPHSSFRSKTQTNNNTKVVKDQLIDLQRMINVREINPKLNVKYSNFDWHDRNS